MPRKACARLTEAGSWKLAKQCSSIAPAHVWTNADQDPVPRERQTWTKYAFIAYWYSDIVSISTWSAGSAIVATGLTATDAILIVLVASICNAVPTVLNGAIGADLHIPFPIAIRASFGYWLSYFCVVSRGVLALFWFGVQGASGGTCITQMLTAIWPAYADLPNHLPASAGTTSQGLLSYLLYWLLQFPLLLVPTHRLQYMFWAKAALATPTALAMVAWITWRAGGSGAFFYAPATVAGEARAWLWLSSLTSVTGGYSTLCVNIPDFARFSRDRGAQAWQLPVIPVFKTLVGALGVVSASAAQGLYGEPLWTPLEVVAKWQHTPGGRAAAFFAAAVWLLCQISVNVSANAVSFANDATTLAPRYLNLKRGVVLVSLLGGWALCPWLIVSSAAAFLNFMSAYAIFMAPIAGIMCADYWLVKKRRYDVPALYDPDGMYRYGNRWGGNWRALAAALLVIVPLLPGLGNKVAPQHVDLDAGLKHLFAFNWLYGFFLSVFLYVVLNHFFPHRATLLDRVVMSRNQPAMQSVADGTESQEAEVRRPSTVWQWCR